MKRGARAPTSTVLILLALIFVGCAERPRPPAEVYEGPETIREILEEAAPPPEEEAPPAIAEGRVRVPVDPRDREPPPILPAAHGDEEWAGAEPVIAQRYVYRVRMIVPAWLGESDERITRPAAELHVDVAHERLRARLTGPGWPVDPGSEVRLRRDRPGVYLYDSSGGRALEPGELAAWFEGGPVTRRGPPLRVFAHYGFPRGQPPHDDLVEPGELVCALIAELANDPRNNVMRRCERGAPHFFRFGFWRAEQTAALPIELTRADLRADERGAHPTVPPASRSMLESQALGRIEADSRDRDALPGPLTVRNDSANRVIVAVNGVAIGWVDRGRERAFIGLSPGTYEVGTIRPFGAVVQRGRAVPVPGSHRVCDGRCPRHTPP